MSVAEVEFANSPAVNTLVIGCRKKGLSLRKRVGLGETGRGMDLLK